jgi:hypothetical protein
MSASSSESADACFLVSLAPSVWIALAGVCTSGAVAVAAKSKPAAEKLESSGLGCTCLPLSFCNRFFARLRTSLAMAAAAASSSSAISCAAIASAAAAAAAATSAADIAGAALAAAGVTPSPPAVPPGTAEALGVFK